MKYYFVGFHCIDEEGRMCAGNDFFMTEDRFLDIIELERSIENNYKGMHDVTVVGFQEMDKDSFDFNVDKKREQLAGNLSGLLS
jgi:hypothetical protein